MSDSNSDGVLDRANFDFGTCLDSFDNVANANDQITIFVVVAARDVASVFQGVQLTVS